MHKEQVIIDGVDVSECKHHRKCILPDNIGCEIDDFLCCDKPNCDYKQLARKTQECEKLKKKLDRSEKWRIKAESLNEKLSINKYRYRKALEDIEEVTKYLKEDLYGHCGWYGTDGCTLSGMVCEELIKILNVINKAKDCEK